MNLPEDKISKKGPMGAISAFSLGSDIGAFLSQVKLLAGPLLSEAIKEYELESELEVSGGMSHLDFPHSSVPEDLEN